MTQVSYIDVPLESQFQLISDLGATWYRIDLTPGVFRGDTARVDDILTNADRHRVRLLPVLVYPDNGGPSETPDRVRTEAFAFAKAVAGRYRGRISHWELGNELDAYALLRKGDRTRIGNVWQWGDPDGSSPDHYEENRYERVRAALQGLGDGIRSADPGARTLVDTAGWLHYGFIERLVVEDRVPFDVLAWHWYSEMGDMNRVQGTFDLVGYLARFGKPIWVTEVNLRGGGAGPAQVPMADYMSRSVRALGTNPGISGGFVYELLDEPYLGSGEADYGLVRVDRDPQGKWRVAGKKPAFEAMRSAIAALRGTGAAAAGTHK